MKRRDCLLVLAGLMGAAMLGGGCASQPAAVRPPLVIISLDGFRADYPELHRDDTPHLRELMRTGVSATGLIPVFPSNTFPNHYSIVTGLYPAHHGIINNTMFDPAFGEFFRYNRPASATESKWWGGEPVWVTAIRQGGHAGCWFWPGSESEIGGIRPHYWRPYDAARPFAQRLDELVAWLQEVRASPGPTVATFYLEETNSVGHRHGPTSSELAATLRDLDDRVHQIQSRLRAVGIDPNLVIVSDHGMTPISAERVILLDDYLDLARVQVDFDGPLAGLRPLAGTDVAALVQALSRAPHAKVYRAEELPARFHLQGNPRIPPVWVLPEEGFGVYRRAQFDTFRERMNQADHGYDPALPSMHGVFIAHGPSFRSGVKIPAVENVHLYNLFCATLGLRPAPNDGDARVVQAALRRP